MSKFIKPSIKAVLFDWDDNLVDTLGTKSDQHKHVALQHYGKELTDEEIRAHWGKPLDVLLGLLYDTEDTQTAMQHVLAYHSDFPKAIFPETSQVLRSLSTAGYILGVVTATSRFSLEHDLEMFGIADEFSYIQTQEDTKFHKPDPRVFEPTIEWLKLKDIKPSETIYLGDGLHDMHAANGAGFNFIGTARGLVTVDEFSSKGAVSIDHIGKLV
jgi:HAD superfamily hydrolase (TIGR01549 family)